MASNKELMSDITTLCLARGVAVPDGLDQLKNPKLVELLDDLRQAPPPSPVVDTPLRPLVAPSPPEGVSGTGATPPPETPALVVTTPQGSATEAPATEPSLSTPKPVTTGAGGYYVAEGKTVNPSTGRETLGAFQQVYASDFQDGIESLERLRAGGYLFKR